MLRTRALLLVLALAALGAACSSDGGASQDERPSVVAAFYPLFDAADRIAGDRAEVTDLTPPGAEPHDVELSPPDVDLILDADLLLYLGGGFQPAVEDLAAQREAGSVDLLEGLPMLQGGHEEEEEGHAEEVDPHVWLDPLLMAQLVDRIAAALVEVDPTGADDYMLRADSYTGELEALHAEFEAGLEMCERRLLVTAHTAFGYLAARYQLQQEGVTGIAPEAEPDPQRLAELSDLVRATGTTTVFTEELVSPEVAETLAREAGVETGVLDTLEAAPAEGGSDEGYVDRMRSNLTAIGEALGCSR